MKTTLFISLLLSTILFGYSQAIAVASQIYVCPPCGNGHCDNIEHDKPGICSHCQMPLIKKGSQKTIAFYLQDRVEVLDFAGPLEVFAYAGYKVFTVSKTKDPIKSQGILTVTPDYSIKDAPKADILAFFGGNSSSASNDKSVIKWVKDQKEIQYHFSVCTGAFILGEAGILKGKTATTFHNALDGLRDNYPETDVRYNARFVDNGRVITTAGVSAGIDGALHLVAKLQGLSVAKRTAYYMEYDWKPGNGLILSDDNPYNQQPSTDRLNEFLGNYEFKGNNTIEVSIKDNDLVAVVDGRDYPVFFEQEDLFTDVDGEPIFFQRDANKAVIGYKLEENGQLYKKLK